jgi:dienelactone hydrolase
MGHGLFQAPILIQMASQGVSSIPVCHFIAEHVGVTIFANGGLTNPSVAPSLDDARKAGQTVRENLMAKAIDFAGKQKSSAKWGHLDLTKIAAAGQSCGGMETLAMAGDKRITTLGIFNSASPGGKGLGGGLLPLPNGGRIPGGANITVPTWFFLGGPRDMANAKVRHSRWRVP